MTIAAFVGGSLNRFFQNGLKSVAVELKNFYWQDWIRRNFLVNPREVDIGH